MKTSKINENIHMYNVYRMKTLMITLNSNFKIEQFDITIFENAFNNRLKCKYIKTV